ncbi:lytic transglycosylase [Amylibacter marinus]|uniref:Lytic transglycosylase n=1 Tax=Amylibacter marinus TaxID=1475483 RepID=A0ABQ5VWU5_9RHOB|nr:lytic murein transglycosylase [Amylibacter marinus]GLQ35748.1 lytic transglycosylase [Amylibacter marinus]
MKFLTSLGLIAALTLGAPALAKCGGSFNSFVKGLEKEARDLGHSRKDAKAFFANTAQDPKVLKLDRSQAVFRQNFTKFAGRVVSSNRLKVGAAKHKQYASAFKTAQADYGVPAPVLLAFWAMETDFGANQGGFNTLNALATLAHDCRRPDLFRPQIFAALELWKQGTFSPTKSRGAWAGEIGMVQMLPRDVLTKGVDGNRDGKVDLVNSAPDAILTAARVLQSHGWQAGQPWMVEVNVPSQMDWSKTGLGKPQKVSAWKAKGVKLRTSASGNLNASLLLPEGRKGPAFLVFDNFDVYFKWNKSLVNVTSAAYFATRLNGAPRFNIGTPDAPLSGDQMKSLQSKLAKRGYDVGKIDGILGAKTRAAVQAEQQRLKLPADAWPTVGLLGKL